LFHPGTLYLFFFPPPFTPPSRFFFLFPCTGLFLPSWKYVLSLPDRCPYTPELPPRVLVFFLFPTARNCPPFCLSFFFFFFSKRAFFFPFPPQQAGSQSKPFFFLSLAVKKLFPPIWLLAGGAFLPFFTVFFFSSSPWVRGRLLLAYPSRISLLCVFKWFVFPTPQGVGRWRGVLE